MKSLLTIFTLVLTVYSSISSAEWTKMTETADGDTFYLDFERIRKVDGYIYWWDLIDNLTPTPTGELSAKMYRQGDCKLFRLKTLSFVSHKEPMGGGTVSITYSPKNPEWEYPPPNSVVENILKKVCSR